MTTCDTVSGRCGAVPCHLLGDCLAPLRFEAIVHVSPLSRTWEHTGDQLGEAGHERLIREVWQTGATSSVWIAMAVSASGGTHRTRKTRPKRTSPRPRSIWKS
jgi:hypothetical protein